MEAIDAQLDVSLFKTEYQKRHFTNPEQVHYENYYNGVYKGIIYIYIIVVIYLFIIMFY